MSRQTKTQNRTCAAETLSPEDQDLYRAAWDLTRTHHGNNFTFYLPGMIRRGRRRGCYPAISITGSHCQLQCEHCKGRLLETMAGAEDPATLLQAAKRYEKNGALGVLLSGGSDRNGNLPWERFAGAIREIKESTGLFISAHVGFPGKGICKLLQRVGLSQALFDVMGDQDTVTEVYHLPSLTRVVQTMEAMEESGLEWVPHIVAGLHYGTIRGEYEALELISRYDPAALVIVVITPLSGTPMAGVTPPPPIEVGRLIAHARLRMPRVPIALGCERPRNRDGEILECLAIRAGATRMAVWSDTGISEARSEGLIPRIQYTCCSAPYLPSLGEPLPTDP